MRDRFGWESCRPLLATPDPLVNAATCGLPAFLVPEQSRQKPAEITAGGNLDLTIRAGTEYDFYASAIMIAVYKLAGSAGSRTATRQDPDPESISSGTASDIRVTIEDSSTGRTIARNEPWYMLGGSAARPQYFGVPHTIPAGRQLKLSLTNNDASNAYAVAVTLLGRRKKTLAAISAIRLELEDRIARLPKRRRVIHESNTINFRKGPGRPKTWGVHELDVSSGNYDTLTASSPVTLRNSADAEFYARHLTVQQLVASAATWTVGATLPIFVEVYNHSAEYWLTQGVVPMEHLGGWGGEPMILPTDWLWEPSDEMSLNFYSAHSATVAVDVTASGREIKRESRR